MTDRTPFNSARYSLTREFGGTFSKETIDRVFQDSYDRLAATAMGHQYIDLFAEGFAHERLRAIAQSEGSLSDRVPEVLFVCVHNAGRSQMAAALLANRSQGKIHVRSAGSTPAAEINPAVTAAMAEIGIDLSQEFPKPLTDEVVRAADVVVTMGCGDACPIYPGKRYLDWELPDPAGKSLQEVRAIRDEIDKHVQTLVTELVNPAKSRSGGR